VQGEIRLEELVKAFGPDVVAVDGIDLNMPPGEFFTMVGPSGCGKTTTLRMIAGFERPTSGRILLDGEDVAQTPPHRRNVNTVFQSYALFPHLNVADNVAFGLKYKKVTKAERAKAVAEALALVQLTGFEKRKPGQLSGGQQQRVALARALVLRPRVLLLDEPLGALDARLRKDLQVELKTLQETLGITFVFVSGCGVIPSVNILGSFFPAWLISIVAGVVLTVLTRQAFLMARIAPYVRPAAVAYGCLILLWTSATWLVVFAS